MAGELNEIPTSLEPVGKLTLGNKELDIFVSSVWYKFFVSLSDLLSNLVGGVLGFSSESNITATGTTQADAYPLTTEWAEITTTPVGSGVILNGFGAGVASTLFNMGANSLDVYPPPGAQIDALGLNVPYPLPAAKTQIFNQTATDQWRSTQLG